MGYTVCKNEEESALWIRFKSGDGDALAEIYEKYVDILYNYGYHIVPDISLVQDAIQDLFAALWQTRGNLAIPMSVKYYLFRSLRRQIYRSLEAARRYEAFPDPDVHRSLFSSFSHETLLIENETLEEQFRTLQNALLNLPARQLEAIRLRFFERFELQEVAGIMQMNEQSVRNLIQRAIRKLRQAFDLLPLLLTFFDFL